MKADGCKKLLRTRHFPFSRHAPRRFKNWVVVGFGGNVGEVARRFERVFWRFERDRRFFVAQCSPLLLNAAFGYTQQADFLNAVVLLKTSLNAADVLKITQNLEKRFGRIRSFKNAPRTLDLDLLFFSRKTLQSERLLLPHPHAKRRWSVMLLLGLMQASGQNLRKSRGFEN